MAQEERTVDVGVHVFAQRLDLGSKDAGRTETVPPPGMEEDLCVAEDSGVIDDDVGAAELSADDVGETCDALRVGHVQPVSNDAQTFFLKAPGGGARLRLVAGGDDHLHPPPREPATGLKPEATVGPGDDGHGRLGAHSSQGQRSLRKVQHITRPTIVVARSEPSQVKGRGRPPPTGERDGRVGAAVAARGMQGAASTGRSPHALPEPGAAR